MIPSELICFLHGAFVSNTYFHKKNGTYYFSVMLDGRQYHRSSRQSTLAGARIVAEQFIQARMIEKFGAQTMATTPPPAVVTLQKLADRWEATQDEEASSGHLRNVRDHVRLHLKPLHDLPVDQIGIEEIQPVIKAYCRTHAVASANGLRRTVNLLFAFAKRAKLIRELPFPPLRKRKEPVKRRVILGAEHYSKIGALIAKARNSHIPLMVALLLATGVRRIDVLRAQWEDMDLERGIWAPTIIKDGDPLVFELDPWLIAELKKLARNGLWMFPSAEGQPHGKEFLRRTLARVGRELGVGRLGTHSLRASYITYLAEQGVPIPTIAALVGHSDIRVTMKYLVKTKYALDIGLRAAQKIAQAAIPGLAGASWPSQEDLQALVLAKPVTVVAKDLGVSAKAVEKRCRDLGLETRPRGYWAKQRAKVGA
ncbi:tyrosine-type recombinase/integrase [Holophaga foetida]|uniref:tyrosine-type recombinase/integrase n=1 Tax=Holophaga foetida TaxID=35839 RepID=UPI00030A3E38|nr:site-specific integrase [Holophaga foetida]